MRRRLSSQPSLSRDAARVLFRSLLRACDNGRRPEVLPMIGPSSEADSCRSEAAALPRTPSEVIQAMRSSSAEAFSALRHSSESARALHPSPDSLPPTLPAFVLPSHTLLPGERADFVFFEPRYVALARQVLGLDGGASMLPPDRRFAHLPDADGVGVIASILHHSELPDGRHAVHVLAGPRCRVTRSARLERIDSTDESPGPPPLLHVEYELQRDDPPPADDAAADAALARDLLERIAALVPAGRGGLAALQPNAPPLLCAERLSFYLCSVLLLASDAKMRSTWLRECSTRARLAFVGDLVMRAEEQRPSSETE